MRRQRLQVAKGVVLFTVMFIGMVYMLFTSSFGNGPIILGTELNGNGTVEYLCLGQGCNNLQSMDW